MSILKFKKANCKNCYKCIRNCQIKAIEVSYEQAQVIESECVLCGNCVLACPQNAKEVRNDIEKVKELIKEGNKVIATVAPSFISDFNVSGIDEFERFLQKLGFECAYETAQGAYLVKSEYEKIIKSRETPFVISSCCATVNLLIQKKYPELQKKLAAVITPMEASARFIKEKNPNAKVVFIGPCISKKYEGQKDESSVDIVLTFEEIIDYFNEQGVKFTENESVDLKDKSKYLSRLFPRVGGIIQSMEKDADFNYITIDGMEESIAALEELKNFGIKNCFIEMSACKGGCINGPMIRRHKNKTVKSFLTVGEYATSESKNDFNISTKINLNCSHKFQPIVQVSVGEKVINEILIKMKKFTKSDELNCGACGYQTCRDKAIAVYKGIADISMCLPYMREKAENFSETIIRSSPNGIITIDNKYAIKQINLAALRIYNINNNHNLIGRDISNLMDLEDIIMCFEMKKNDLEKKVYLPDYDKTVMQSLIYDKESDVVICILRDITSEEKSHYHAKKVREEAVEITNKVIERQMMAVQEIAFLLGETTAETKVALTKLKSSVFIEGDKNE